VSSSAPRSVAESARALAATWRHEAANSLRGWGASCQADAVERCAAQLEAVLADEENASGGDR